MKKNYFTVLFVFFCIHMILSCQDSFAATEVAAGSCGDNVTWRLTRDGVLSISGEGEITGGTWQQTDIKPKKVVIDEGVTSISGRWIFGDEEIEEITIPNSVIKIGDCVFQGCGVKTLRIPDSVIEIGEYAFSKCEKLEQIRLSENLNTISAHMFSSCSRLKKIEVPDSVIYIGEGAFSNMDSLEEIVLGGGLQKVGGAIFEKSYRLRKIINHSSVILNIKNTKTAVQKVIWSAGRKRTEVVPGNCVAIGKGKKYKLSYRLNGAKVKGKLPKNYRYGDVVKFPVKVRKKGYIFSGWNVISPENQKKGKKSYGLYRWDDHCELDSVQETCGDKIVTPRFYKIYITKRNKTSVNVKVDISKSNTKYFRFTALRYSTDPNMGTYRVKYSYPSTKTLKSDYVLKGLKKRKRYYIDVMMTDDDWFFADYWENKKIDYLPWDGRKIYRHK